MKVHEFMHEMRTTSAILGRTSNIQVRFEGDQACTDGKHITLPALPQQMDLSVEQVLSMRGFVDHEAGHNRHSDMPRIMSFYDKNVHNGREDLCSLHNALEDVWMEEKVLDEYPGAWKNLRQCHEMTRAHEVREFKADPEGFNTAVADPNWLAGSSIILNKNEDFWTPNNEVFRSMLPEGANDMGAHWAELARQCKNSGELIELAKKIYQYVDQTPPPEQSPDDFDQKDQDGELNDLAGEDAEGPNSPGYRGPGDKEARAAASQGKGKSQGDSEGEGAKGNKLKEATNDMGKAMMAKDAEGAGGIGDCQDNGLTGGYKVYTTEHDIVYKRGGVRVPGESKHVRNVVEDTEHTMHYDERKGMLRADVMVMKNKLRRSLMARQQRDWDFGREYGRLDSKRLVAASQGVKQVWKRRTDREDHDTAISILIDLSGSMGGTKAETARDCAIALSECFEGTSMSYRISGFSNNNFHGRSHKEHEGQYHRYERLDHSIFKDYDDPLRVVRGSVHQIHHAVGGNNSDYDFVDAELFGLSRRPEKRKVLFVLSDGHVACTSDASKLEHVRLIRENLKYYKSRYSVESVGIGINSDAVEKIYPDHVVVTNVSDLSGAAFGMLTNILFRDK